MMSLWHNLVFREPWWLLIAAQPVLPGLLAVGLRYRRREDYAQRHLLPWARAGSGRPARQRLRGGLLMALSWTAFAIAMAGPRLPLQRVDQGTEQYAETIAVLDLSQSMAARDLPPNRIERARLELLDLIDRMQAMRLGIVVFAARPHVLTPPTPDKGALRYYVSSLKTRLLPGEGTRLTEAIEFGSRQFSTNGPAARALLVVSDGETQGSSAGEQAELERLMARLRQQNIRVYVLGVGTRAGGAVFVGESGWLQHDGRPVVSKLQKAALQQIAALGNGAYSDVDDGDAEWRRLYDDGLARLSVVDIRQDQDRLIVWQELYFWFVLIGMSSLGAALWQPRQRGPAALAGQVVAMVLCFISTSGFDTAQAAPVTYVEAHRLYQHGKYQSAYKSFLQVPGYRGRMGEGAAAYRLKQFEAATAAFIQAALDADSDSTRADALFNLANSYFQRQEYRTAAAVYRDVLRYAPTLGAASVNLAYALALDREVTRQDRVAQRAGRGPGSARAAEGMDLSQGGLVLGEADKSPADSRPSDQAGRNDAGADNRADTILIQRARPAARAIERDEDSPWTYDITTLHGIENASLDLDTDASEMWQRLFETEEGIPAPQERLYRLPGVAPW